MRSSDEDSELEDLGTLIQFGQPTKRPEEQPTQTAPPDLNSPFDFVPRKRLEATEAAPATPNDARAPFLDETPLSAPGESNSQDSLGAPPLPLVIVPGEPLFEQYLPIRLLGKGGMGEVWLVENIGLCKKRALKLIRPDQSFSHRARERFRREAKLMGEIEHINSVTVHTAKINESMAFIEMEFLQGKSLDELIERGRPTPLAWAYGVMEQLCAVLHAIHSPQINTVHRDLKPPNLMLLDSTSKFPGRLKLLDLGIAKSLNVRESTSAATLETGAGLMMFTAYYASPEQINQAMSDGESTKVKDVVDHRADLYAVGVLLYQFLTGFLPFEGTLQAILLKHLNAPPPKFADRNPRVRVPAGVERLVMRCLEKDREKRPQSAKAIIEEFRRHLPTEILTGTVPETQPDYPSLWPSRFDGTDEFAVWRSGESKFAKSSPPRWRRLAAVLGVVACLAGVAWRMYSGGHDKPLPPPPPIEPIAPKGDGLPQWLRERGYNTAPNATMIGRWPDRIVRQVGDREIGFKFIPSRGEFELGHARLDPRLDPKEDDSNLAEGLPPKRVSVSDFYMQEFEVTNAEIAAFISSSHFQELAKSQGLRAEDLIKKWAPLSPRFNPDGTKLPSDSVYPVCGVSHRLAEEYARWIGGELPTESQWEFAARSGGKNVFVPWGREGEPFNPNNQGGANGEKKRVILDAEDGQFALGAGPEDNLDRTEQGVFDLLGNLREWCRDATVEGSAPNKFVVRGGSFMTPKNQVSVYSPRSVLAADAETITQIKEKEASRDIGFRVVVELEPPQ